MSTSALFRLDLMANGSNSTTWGTVTNTNWELMEVAVSGVVSVAMTDANYTLTTATAATDEARNAVITMTGTTTASRDVIVPSTDKTYVIKNSTTGGYPIVVKTAAGTGVTIANGVTALVYCDATNVLPQMTGGATTDILVGGGTTTTPVWTAATGSGAPVRATSPTIVTPVLTTPALGNSSISGIKVAAFNGEVSNATTTGAVTVDWTAGACQKQTEPTGIITYTFTPPVTGVARLQLRILSDGTSTAYTHVFPAAVTWVGTTWAAVANKGAILTFFYDGTTYWAQGANTV